MKSVIIIEGPTAVGKTAKAIEVAAHFNTVILSADSRQCYKELKIGVARPSDYELQQVPHYFIASNSIHDNINAAWYESYALTLLNELFKQHEVVVVTGGTGLYIKALTNGLDDIPDVDFTVRAEIVTQYEENGIEWLQHQINTFDPLFATNGEMQNPQRMMRALEVVQSTGKSIFSFRKQKETDRPFNIIEVGLELARNELYNRINKRVDDMVQQGLEDEAKSLLPYKNLNALQTVGYKELFSFFDGTISFDEAIALIKQHTRQYAKRQMTWFKKQENVKWLNMNEAKSFVQTVSHLVKEL